MKLKHRIGTAVFGVCGITAVLSVVFLLHAEQDHDLKEITFRRQVPGRMPHIRTFRKINLDAREYTNSSQQPDSNKAEEVTPASNETLSLKGFGNHPPNGKGSRLSKHKIANSKPDRNCGENMTSFPEKLFSGEYPDLTRLLNNFPDSVVGDKRKPKDLTIQEILGIDSHQNMTNMEKFYLRISQRQLYKEDEELVKKILLDMSTLPIVNVVEKEGGTQLKLLFTFHDGSQALFKPMRFGRKKETLPDHFYFVDFERHVSEIATFHLDRILGFRRTPPVTGRLVNITSEIYVFAEESLLKTFFISPGKNICFHGTCSYYCDTSHAICGHPDMLEGSFAMFLPPTTLSKRKTWKNPWRRSYHKRRRAEWELNDNYCNTVRKTPPYDSPNRLVAVIDMAILDFLTGNMDRHHYETFKLFGNDTFIVHLDHGRGFGKSNHDEISILAPLYQCCFLSFSTFRRLLELHNGPMNLSHIMRCSLHKDPLDPVLLEGHLRALDRRLAIILEVIRDCLTRHSAVELLHFLN